MSPLFGAAKFLGTHLHTVPTTTGCRSFPPPGREFLHACLAQSSYLMCGGGPGCFWLGSASVSLSREDLPGALDIAGGEMVTASVGAELKPASTRIALKLTCQIVLVGAHDRPIGTGAAHQV